MKGIFKLFPVAIAALAFVSCSDDLEGSGYSTKQIPDNALRFSIGSNSNMRAGFVGDVMASAGQIQFRWVGGDVIRVYQDDLATWDKYTYAGAEFGTDDVFTPDGQNELDSYSIGVYPADEVEGVYMDKNDKDIKHIQMDLPVEYDYQEGLNTDADGSAGYRCDLPLYGAITSTAQAVTEMNFLSAYVRIYLRDLPKNAKYIALVSTPTGTNVQPLTGRFIADVPKTITASTVGGVETDNAPILLKKGEFSQTFGNIVYAKVNLTKYSYAAGTDAAVKDSAAICFPVLANNAVTRAAGGTLQTYDNLTIYAWGDRNASGAYATPADVQAANAWATEVANGNATVIKTRANWTPTRRRSVWTVRYTEPLIVDVDNYNNKILPGDLTDLIASKANTAITDLELSLISSTNTAGTLTSSEGYERNHVTTLPAMKNGGNIIINLESADIDLETKENWTINGNDFDGTLVVKPGKMAAGSTATSKIEINLPNADVQIIGDATNDITNIDVQQCQTVTIGDPENGTVTTVPATKTVVVRDGEARVVTGATVNMLKTEDNLTNHTKTDIVKVIGGTVTTLDNNTNTDISLYGDGVNEAIINTLNLADVDGAINIYSEGKASIGNLTAPVNTPTGGGLEFLTIKSKLTEQAAGILASATVTGTYGGNNAIFTAAQLTAAANSGITTATTIMADEIDLNDLSWSGGNVVDVNVIGNNHDATTGTWNNITTATGATLVANKQKTTATGKNVIKNLKIAATTGSGLFKNINASGAAVEIAGLEIQNPSFTNTLAAVDNIGVVAGTMSVAAANNIDFTNIKVTGLTVASKGGNGVGGLIGAITAAQTGIVTVKNVDVAATSVAARSFVGGIIGRISANATAINIYDSKVNVAAVSLSLADGVTTLYPTYAGTWASYIGGTENNPTVALNIYDSSYGTAINKAIKGNGINNQGLRFGANANSSDVPFFGGNPWIGFCGTATGTSNTTLTTYKSVSAAAADKGINFYKYAYAPASMTVTRWNGAGNYAETTQKALDGGALKAGATTIGANSVQYDGTNAAGVTTSKAAGSFAWKSGYKYGTTIYSIYDTSALDPDALGYTTYEPTSF